jgi:hypothetical protein
MMQVLRDLNSVRDLEGERVHQCATSSAWFIVGRADTQRLQDNRFHSKTKGRHPREVRSAGSRKHQVLKQRCAFMIVDTAAAPTVSLQRYDATYGTHH